MRNLERKEDIRKRTLKLRSMQDAVQWKQKTDIITNVIVSHPWFAEAKLIYCYMDFRGEVGTKRLIEEAWKCGKSVCVPRVTGKDMEFYEITSFSELRKGAFGILEPPGESGKITDSEGLMIMPGAAFDKARNRIGYGRGYYDRYLAAHPGLHTIAAAFSLQVVDAVESEETDIKPEIIVTEAEIYC